MDTSKTRGWSLEQKISYYSADTNDGSNCILWTATPNSGGYGQLWVSGRYRLIHRVVLEKKLGRPIKRGLQACHECHNRLCVNPDHLREDTHVANLEDRRISGRLARGERQGNARLTTEQVLMIRSDPRSERVLAREMGVCANVIGSVRRRSTWKHIP